MANLSDLFPSASASPIKSVQSGYVNSSSLTLGSGEDLRYLDVSVSSVDSSKIISIEFVGGLGSGSPNGMSKSGGDSAFQIIPRLTSPTNLRLAAPEISGFSSPSITGRWRIVEAV